MEPPNKCTICFSETESDYLDIFAKVNVGKNIAAVISKHLWLEIISSVKNQQVCIKCWCALESFHTFYLEVEQLHHPERPASTSNGNTRAVSPSHVAGETYKTEFLEIKGEPVEDDEDDGGQCNPMDGEPYINPQCDETMQSDGSSDSIQSMPDNDVAVRNKRSISFCSTWVSKSPKKGQLNRPVPSRKPEGHISLHPKQDEAILEFYKRIVCEVCDNQRMIKGEPLMEFPTWSALLRHTKEVHGHYKIFVQCPVCETKLRTKVTLWHHMDMHTNPEKYRCKVCSEVHQNMQEHMQNKHEERQFSCDLCGSKFPFKARLVKHMKKMHTEKDVPCDQCHKSFTKYTIEDHKRSVHMARFVCEHCPKTFKIRFRLQKHMQEHDQSLRTSTSVPCPICGQVMSDKYILRQHTVRQHTHHEGPAVDCETCGKTFKNKRNLSVHLANVCKNTAQLTSCPTCGKQFRHKTKLKGHVSSCIPH